MSYEIPVSEWTHCVTGPKFDKCFYIDRWRFEEICSKSELHPERDSFLPRSFFLCCWKQLGTLFSSFSPSPFSFSRAVGTWGRAGRAHRFWNFDESVRARFLCDKFPLNPLKLYLTRETDTKRKKDEQFCKHSVLEWYDRPKTTIVPNCQVSNVFFVYL